ncbi:MAG: hypothetical protein ACK41D_09930 [Rubricoccaceae bacterium]
MHRLRHRFCCRLTAFLLLAGTALSFAPAALAREAHASALQSRLGDASAVEKALAAARPAATPEAFVRAFVHAYVRAAGADAAYPEEALAALLTGHVFGLMAEDGPRHGLVPHQGAPPPTPASASPGVLASSCAAPVLAAEGCAAPAESTTATRVALRAHPARAP